MDMRKWFLLNSWSMTVKMKRIFEHIPCSDLRSPSVLKLFFAGYQCGFKLTTPSGHPTIALHLMAALMDAELCQAKNLPDEEKTAFGKDDGTLANVFDESWYLRGITERVLAAQASTAQPVGRDKWHWDFLPHLDGTFIRYKDPDGKRRKRQCWIAYCPPNWEMKHDVYNGLWRWTRECLGPPDKYRGFSPVPWPDAYTLIREAAAAALGSAGSERATSGCDQEACSASAPGLQAAGGGVQQCRAERSYSTAVG